MCWGLRLPARAAQVYTNIRRFKEDLTAYPPHFFICVPLVLDTLYTRVRCAAALTLTLSCQIPSSACRSCWTRCTTGRAAVTLNLSCQISVVLAGRTQAHAGLPSCPPGRLSWVCECLTCAVR